MTVLIYIGSCNLGTSQGYAQYQSQQFGIEAGYQFIEDDLGLISHGANFGARGGFKISDHWWLTARSLISFRGDVTPKNRTNIVLHLTPIDARYYIWTDSLRPFLGVASCFHLVFNTSLSSVTQWGPGLLGGIEFKIRRDLFLGIQVDGNYLISFNGEDTEAFQTTTQLIFFM